RWPKPACCGPCWRGRPSIPLGRPRPLLQPTLRRSPASDDDGPAARGVPAAVRVCVWLSHVAVRWSAPPISLRGCVLSQQRVCQLTLDRGGATRATLGNGKLKIVFITGFPAGLLQCNC